MDRKEVSEKVIWTEWKKKTCPDLYLGAKAAEWKIYNTKCLHSKRRSQINKHSKPSGNKKKIQSKQRQEIRARFNDNENKNNKVHET